MRLQNLQNYAFLIRKFRNAPEMIRSVRNGDTCQKAVLWNGKQLTHPAESGGFVGTLLELWHDDCYTRGSFYRPDPGDTVVDLGAHVGLFTISMALLEPACQILAFEPYRDNYLCLATNVKAFDLRNVDVYRMALSDRYGHGSMRAHTDRSIDHQLEVANEQSDQVPTVPLEGLLDLADRPHIDFLKMDVEGAEKAAFDKASEATLKRFRRIAMEYHDNLAPGCLQTIVERLRTTHRIEVTPTEDRGYGILRAVLR